MKEIMANSNQTLELHLRLISEDILSTNNLGYSYLNNVKYNKLLDYANILVGLLHDLGKTSIFFQNRLNNNLLGKKEKADIKEYHNWGYIFFKDIYIQFIKNNNIDYSDELLETISYAGSMSVLNHHFDLDNKSKIDLPDTLNINEAVLLKYNGKINEEYTLKEYIELIFREGIINQKNINHVYKTISEKTKDKKIKELSLFISNYKFDIKIFNGFGENNTAKMFSDLLSGNEIKKETNSLLFNNFIIDKKLTMNLLNFIFLPNLIFIDKKISIGLTENDFVRYNKEDNNLILDYYFKNFPIEKSTGLNLLRSTFFKDINSNIDKSKKIHIIQAPAGIGKFLSLTSYATQLMSNELNKVIYIAPFVSILDQNANVLKENILNIKGEINNLEFSKINYLAKKRFIINKEFSNIDNLEKENYSYLEKYMLKGLNSKYIFTTFVNIFNSLYGFKNIDYVQTHALLNNSILIIDEIQDFNKENLYFLKYFLKEIVPNHNIKVIISSATIPQYIYGDIDENDLFFYSYYNKNKHLEFENNKFFNRCKLELLTHESNKNKIYNISDITYDINNEKLYKKIIEKINKNRKILFINNTINSSEELGNKILDRLSINGKEGDILEDSSGKKYIYYFLNNKRKNKFEKDIIIEKIKKHDDNITLLLFSTQLIKAGVDIDMDICFSDFFNLYDITQIMGRVNRNNKRSFENTLYLYSLQNGSKMDFEKITGENDYNNTYLFIDYINKHGLKNNINEQYIYNTELLKFDNFINKNITLKDYDLIFNMLDYESIRNKSKLIKEKENEISYIKDVENILFLNQKEKKELDDFFNIILKTEGKNRNEIEISLKGKKYGLQSFINNISEYELEKYNLSSYLKSIKPLYREISSFVI